MKKLWFAIVPLSLLVAATMALRLEAPDDRPVAIALTIAPDQQPERVAIATILQHLAAAPSDPVSVTWSEVVVGTSTAEHRATYYPVDRRLVIDCAGERFTQTGISEAGMRAALLAGDRHATFAYALAASRSAGSSADLLALTPHHISPSPG